MSVAITISTELYEHLNTLAKEYNPQNAYGTTSSLEDFSDGVREGEQGIAFRVIESSNANKVQG